MINLKQIKKYLWILKIKIIVTIYNRIVWSTGG